MTVCASEESFWLCQFTCRQTDKAEYQDLFAQWSATLTVPGGRVSDQVQSNGTEYDGTVAIGRYDLDCGITLLAADGLEAYSVEGITAYYANNVTGFALLKEEKYEGMTLEEYAAAICQVNGYEDMSLNAYGKYSTEHTYTDGSVTYWYYTTVHETSDAYMMLQYFCYEEDIDTYRPYFELWSSSVEELS